MAYKEYKINQSSIVSKENEGNTLLAHERCLSDNMKSTD